MLGSYSDFYANNQFRALQQFFKWYAEEDPDEPKPNIMLGMSPPKVDEKLVPVFTPEELDALLKTCKGGGFQARRDAAILSLFRDAALSLPPGTPVVELKRTTFEATGRAVEVMCAVIAADMSTFDYRFPIPD
ncbi:hypothetical protein AB0M95_09990 [Sphaerisporangium sp. NPDC051017]|uniref:hypothetical protein n=1 Tax=Sphaerisporangium sp. NPDC051017 TaxID=3154636 RepID=UPI00341CF547